MVIAMFHRPVATSAPQKTGRCLFFLNQKSPASESRNSSCLTQPPTPPLWSSRPVAGWRLLGGGNDSGSDGDAGAAPRAPVEAESFRAERPSV